MSNKKTNRWHAAILRVLDLSKVPMTLEQIWQTMEINFSHKSVNPRATLGARVHELHAAKAVERIGKGLYQRAHPSHHAPPVEEQEQFFTN